MCQIRKMLFCLDCENLVPHNYVQRKKFILISCKKCGKAERFQIKHKEHMLYHIYSEPKKNWIYCEQCDAVTHSRMMLLDGFVVINCLECQATQKIFLGLADLIKEFLVRYYK